MRKTRCQQTIAGPVTVTGFGYWSGRDVRVEFRPSPPGTGIVFIRADVEGCPRVKAQVANRLDTPRRTSLQSGRARVDMVEHVMAALGGLRIDNCEVWVDEAEMPGCDGSCIPFVRALDSAGIVIQDVPQRRRIVRELIRLEDEQSWFEARPPNGRETVLTYHLDYGPESPIRPQSYQVVVSPDSFRRELAASRTFVLESEAQWLLAQGLGKRATARDLLIFAPDGLIDNELRFEDECARHKLMDMIGDLALADCQLVGRFTACRSGHRLNAELVRVLLEKTELEHERRRCA
jgi:UDP-3-O-acyl N-acetylglucosamine deacetylase